MKRDAKGFGSGSRAAQRARRRLLGAGRAVHEVWRFPVPVELVQRCRPDEQLVLVLEFDKQRRVYASFEVVER